jgi:O-acetyl-ADP-ribose deacetylase (regulator of RNase III)
MKYIKGDLITELEEGRIEALGHNCNCRKIMGSGIALALKNKWPEVYQADLDWDVEPRYRLGNITLAEIDADDLLIDTKTIFNLYGQETYGYGRMVNYEAIYTALEAMKNYCLQNGISKVGFPYLMASDRAGGAWPVIEAMIQDVFTPDNQFEVTIVEFDE